MDFAIETNGLSKFYGDVRAVNSVDLHVKPGEIYGFLSLNGAGKTTTIRALLGMIHPSEGNVKVLDRAKICSPALQQSHIVPMIFRECNVGCWENHFCNDNVQ